MFSKLFDNVRLIMQIGSATHASHVVLSLGDARISMSADDARQIGAKLIVCADAADEQHEEVAAIVEQIRSKYYAVMGGGDADDAVDAAPAEDVAAPMVIEGETTGTPREGRDFFGEQLTAELTGDRPPGAMAS